MKEKTVILKTFVFLKSTSKKNLIKTFNLSQTILLQCTVNSKTQKKNIYKQNFSFFISMVLHFLVE
jgi:hypothetical protein